MYKNKYTLKISEYYICIKTSIDIPIQHLLHLISQLYYLHLSYTVIVKVTFTNTLLRSFIKIVFQDGSSIYCHNINLVVKLMSISYEP